MNKLFTRIAKFTLGLAMAIGVGAGIGFSSGGINQAWAADDDFEQVACLDLTTKSVGCNAYNTTTTYGDWKIVNGANNNKGWEYFKMGGKSDTLKSNNPCYIYSTTTYSNAVDKVEVSIVAGSLSKSGMSVKSWGLYVYSNSTLTTQIDYVAGGTITKNAGVFEFTPSEGKTWNKGYYFKVNWDLANTTTTNGIVCVDKITLFKLNGAAPEVTGLSLTPTSAEFHAGESTKLTLGVTGTNIDDVEITISASEGLEIDKTKAKNGDSIEVTANSACSGTITASYSDVTSAQATITVNAPRKIEYIAVKTNPSKINYEVGDYFEPSGLEINVNYAGQETPEVVAYNSSTMDEFSFNPTLATPLEEGLEKVEVTYKEKSADVSITVTFKTIYECISGTHKGDKTFTNGIVTVSGTNGDLNASPYKFYANSTTTISTSKGYIVSITFDSVSSYSYSAFSVTSGGGSFDTSTGIWKGCTSTVAFKASSQVRSKKIIVKVSLNELPKLNIPNISYDNGKLSWDAVENAAGYELKIDDGSAISLESNVTEYDVSKLAETTHKASIRAKGDYVTGLDSNWSTEIQWDTTPYVVEIISISGSLRGSIGNDKWDKTKLKVTGLYSNNDQKDITSQCTLTVAIDVPQQICDGTTSVTAKFTGTSTATVNDYTDASISYSVREKHSGLTFDDAFTVEEAIQHIDDKDLDGDTVYYTVGLYKKTSTAWSSQYKNISIDVVDDLSSETFLRFFRMVASKEPTFAQGDVVYAKAAGSNYQYYSTGLFYELNVCTMEEEELQSLSVSGETKSLTAGLQFSGVTKATAKYKLKGEEDVTDDVTYTLNNSSITLGAVVPVSAVGANKTVVVSYSDGVTKTASYSVNVSYQEPTSSNISIDGGNTKTMVFYEDATLSATLSGDYIDKSANIIWTAVSNTVNDDFDLDENYLLVGKTEGEIVIRASVENYPNAYATLTVTVNGTPEIKLDPESLTGKFTGDESEYIEADVINFTGTPVIEWTSSDEDVATVDGDDDIAEVNYVGAGTATITVKATYTPDDGPVQEATATCDVSVTQSKVTEVSLDKESITCYTSDTDVELNATVSGVIGNATEDLNWTAEDDTVVSLNPDGKKCEIIPKTAGSTTITAESDYTRGVKDSCTITVNADGLSISWTDREEKNIFAGDKFAFGTSEKVVAKYKNTKRSDVNLKTYPEGMGAYLKYDDNSTKNIDLETYAFELEDNGSKLYLTYKDGELEAKLTQGVEIAVIKWRSVLNKVDASATLTFPNTNGSWNTEGGLTGASFTKGGSTTFEDESLRLGSKDKSGTITISSPHFSVTSLTVNVKSYTGDTDVDIIVNGKTQRISSEYKTYSFAFAGGVDTVTIVGGKDVSSSKKRANFQSFTINSVGTNDIGRTEKCLQIEQFIDNTLNASKSYSEVKSAFAALTSEQRELFCENSAYEVEKGILISMALANGETLKKDSINGYQLVFAFMPTATLIVDSTNNGQTLKKVSLNFAMKFDKSLISSGSRCGFYYGVGDKEISLNEGSEDEVKTVLTSAGMVSVGEDTLDSGLLEDKNTVRFSFNMNVTNHYTDLLTVVFYYIDESGMVVGQKLTINAKTVAQQTLERGVSDPSARTAITQIANA